RLDRDLLLDALIADPLRPHGMRARCDVGDQEASALVGECALVRRRDVDLDTGDGRTRAAGDLPGNATIVLCRDGRCCQRCKEKRQHCTPETPRLRSRWGSHSGTPGGGERYDRPAFRVVDTAL